MAPVHIECVVYIYVLLARSGLSHLAHWRLNMGFIMYLILQTDPGLCISGLSHSSTDGHTKSDDDFSDLFFLFVFFSRAHFILLLPFCSLALLFALFFYSASFIYWYICCMGLSLFWLFFFASFDRWRCVSWQSICNWPICNFHRRRMTDRMRHTTVRETMDGLIDFHIYSSIAAQCERFAYIWFNC